MVVLRLSLHTNILPAVTAVFTCNSLSVRGRSRYTDKSTYRSLSAQRLFERTLYGRVTERLSEEE
jgi:hypothetical protein